MHILWIIIIGFVAGIIARFLAPGPNNPAGFILTTLLGIAGAFVATFIGQAIGWYRPDQGAGLIGAVVGALVVLFVWHRLVATAHDFRSRHTALAVAGGARAAPAARAASSARSIRLRSGRRGVRRSTTTARGEPAAAGDGDAVDVLALPHAQHGAPRLVGGDLHQRRHDLDLLAEFVGQPLRRQHRLFDCRRVAPYPAPAVLCVPYVAHWHLVVFALSWRYVLAYKTHYQAFAALQQENCAVHSRGFNVVICLKTAAAGVPNGTPAAKVVNGNWH